MEKVVQLLRAEEQKLKSKIFSKEKEVAKLKISLAEVQDELKNRQK